MGYGNGGVSVGMGMGSKCRYGNGGENVGMCIYYVL